jgi:hypothetical protein
MSKQLMSFKTDSAFCLSIARERAKRHFLISDICGQCVELAPVKLCCSALNTSWVFCLSVFICYFLDTEWTELLHPLDTTIKYPVGAAKVRILMRYVYGRPLNPITLTPQSAF